MTEPISTAAHPGPYDPIEKAAPDEPVFKLVGRDPYAADTVLHWVSLARKGALDISDLSARKVELMKCLDAEEIAWEMQRWRSGAPAADTTTKRVNYSGQEDSAKRRAERDSYAKLVRACAHLREAQYELELARELLADIGEDGSGAETLRDNAASLASNLEPKRKL